MLIKTDCENFFAKDFIILNFYGEDTCFAWDEDKFIHFKYPCEEITEFKVLKAPFDIKDIRGFSDRVFILCYPKGIYKFKKTGEFAILSKNGIELGSDFEEVFTVSNQTLVLSDKRTKNTKKLFSTSSCEVPSVHVLRLDFDGTDSPLCKALLSEKFNKDFKLCIISHDKKIFQMCDQVVQIIYCCDYSINNIKPIYKNHKVFGVIVQMDANVLMFIHVVDGKLKYDKIFLGVKTQHICGIVNDRNELLLIHSDRERTYYSKKKLIDESVETIRTEEKFYNTFKIYQSKFIIYLNSANELLQVDISSLKMEDDKSENDYVSLSSRMLKNVDYQTEMICQKSDELKICAQKSKEYEDEIRRINLFMKNQSIKYCPKDSVVRISNYTFLVSDFEKVLPANTFVVKMLKSRKKTIFSIKKVTEHRTVVEMPVTLPSLSSKLYSTTDLITYKNDGGVCCLIKNYVKDPTSKSDVIKLSKEKINFVKHKIAVLRYRMQENDITMEDLSEMKREIREYLA